LKAKRGSEQYHEEVAQLIDAAPTAFYRTVLMTLYATGVRNAELTRLKVSDVDSLSCGTRSLPD
jgi:integrase